MKYMFVFLVMLPLVLLTACVSNTISSSSPAPVSWEAHQQKLSQLTNWQMRGRFSLKNSKTTSAPAQTQTQAFSANLFWRQMDQGYDVELFGPVGLGAVKLLGEPGKIELSDSQGNHYQSTSPEALMQQQLGWFLPVSELYYWIRGLPAPGEISSKKLDSAHRLLVLEQSGWKINYQSYQYISNLWLPKKILLQSEILKVTLVINDMLALKG